MTKKQKRMALMGGVFAVAALAVTLVLFALDDAVAYFYTPSDLEALDDAPEDVIRLGGLVAAGSVAYDEASAQVRFTITDEGAMREVVYEGILPDLFREGQGVIAQGRIAPTGELVADQVLAKHDENYMPREVTDALKEQGRWRDGDSEAY